MKRIDSLTVTVTYTVGLGDVEVPDDVYRGLMNNSELDPDDLRLDDDANEALAWLSDHIQERDAMSWNYEVDVD